MSKENTTNLYQVGGGKTIKQNDRSSKFVYELQDEKYKIIPTLEGKRAAIVLVSGLAGGEYKAVYETIATVANGRVEFTITETLEPGTYFVEVLCKGYIFPSTNTVTIEVTKSNFGKAQVEAELEEVREEEIDFYEEVIEDDSMFVGEEVIEQEGEKGVRLVYWDENLQTFMTKEVIKQPTDRIVRKGTKTHA